MHLQLFLHLQCRPVIMPSLLFVGARTREQDKVRGCRKMIPLLERKKGKMQKRTDNGQFQNVIGIRLPAATLSSVRIFNAVSASIQCFLERGKGCGPPNASNASCTFFFIKGPFDWSEIPWWLELLSPQVLRASREGLGFSENAWHWMEDGSSGFDSQSSEASYWKVSKCFSKKRSSPGT